MSDDPSPWVARFAPMVPASGSVLDVACGRGRHTRFFVERGHPVVAVDADVDQLGEVMTHPQVAALQADLEDAPWPLSGRTFAAVVVTNYLHRPLFGDLLEAVAPGGLLLYETFARGQERFGKPTDPDFLLDPGELLEVARGHLRVLAYEDLTVHEPGPKRVQRLCAARERAEDRVPDDAASAA